MEQLLAGPPLHHDAAATAHQLEANSPQNQAPCTTKTQSQPKGYEVGSAALGHNDVHVSLISDSSRSHQRLIPSSGRSAATQTQRPIAGGPAYKSQGVACAAWRKPATETMGRVACPVQDKSSESRMITTSRVDCHRPGSSKLPFPSSRHETLQPTQMRTAKGTKAPMPRISENNRANLRAA